MDFFNFSNFISGETRDASTHFNGVNPSTNETLWKAPIASKQDLDDAIHSAKGAFPTWSQITISQRKKCLRAFKDALNEHRKDFAALLRKEGGKPKAIAAMEIAVALDFFDHHLSLVIEEERLELGDKVIKTRHVPLGVVAAICPWNFPMVLSLGKILPALLTGNCVIVKPSNFTPYTSLKLCEMAGRIFPPGVYQVLAGDDSLGPALVAHPDIQKISFTGSTATGKKIMAEAAKTLKRITLELYVSYGRPTK